MISLVPLTIEDQIRLWSKIDRKSKDECWSWLGKPHNGRGRFLYEGQVYYASRVVYYLSNLKDPGELLVCHTCNNKMCVNPGHFYLGTNSENIQQAYDDGICSHEGELHNRAKLWERDVLEIRRLASLNVSVKELSKLYNVSIWVIYDIIRRKTWRHI